MRERNLPASRHRERDVEARLLVLARRQPAAAGVEPAAVVDQRELVDPPFGAARMGDELELPDVAAAEEQAPRPARRSPATDCRSPASTLVGARRPARPSTAAARRPRAEGTAQGVPRKPAVGRVGATAPTPGCGAGELLRPQVEPPVVLRAPRARPSCR